MTRFAKQDLIEQRRQHVQEIITEIVRNRFLTQRPRTRSSPVTVQIAFGAPNAHRYRKSRESPTGTRFLISVPRDWLERVHQEGIAYLDGDNVLVLAAAALKTVGNAERCWKCRVVKLVSGQVDRIAEGYLVRFGGVLAYSWISPDLALAKAVGLFEQALNVGMGSCTPVHN